MKTSLNLLKTTRACVGGFGRQASFWTVRPKVKAIEYPIWMIGLTGCYDDLQWAITNSLIVDDEEFKQLKDRTFWPMFQCLFWEKVTPQFILTWSKEKPSFMRDALQEGLAIRNVEQAQAWMDKYSRFKIDSPLFNHVVNNQCWRDPQQYLLTMHSKIDARKSETCVEHEKHPFNLDTHVPGHDSRTGVASKTVVKRVSRASKPVKAADEPTVGTYFSLPYDETGRIITDGERFAAVCVNGDPWAAALEFMLANDVPQAIGTKVNVSKVSEDGVKPPQFAASLHLSDPRKIFQIMHLLQGQDFDVLKACLIEPMLTEVQGTVEAYGRTRPDDNTGDSTSVEAFAYTMTESGDEYSIERIARNIKQQREQIEAGQPVGTGALRERVSPTRGTARSETWDSGEATEETDDEEPVAAVAADSDDEDESDY